MGEPEYLIAEPDEIDDEVDGLHPPTLEQDNPRFLSYFVSIVSSSIKLNGWYLAGIFVLGYITWHLFHDKIKSWLRKKEEEKEASEYYKNPDALMAKHRAIDEARQRMQEQYNIAAAISLEKKKEMEEKKREEKIKEWERMQSGQGQTLRSSNSSTSASSNKNSKQKPSTKTSMRPEYNPLTGDTTSSSSSCRWRPSAQRPTGGG